MKATKTIVTLIILVMALLQGPLIYYYSNGSWGFLILCPYCIIGFGLSVFLYKKSLSKETNTQFIAAGRIVGVSLGLCSLFSEGFFEYLDWNLRKTERVKIVANIKKSRINYLVTSHFPPISNGRNRIPVERFEDNTVLIKFYINPGFLDHYSAFCYTNNDSEIHNLEERIHNKELGFEKLGENWYRVNY